MFFRPEFVRTPRRSTGTVTGAIGRIGTTIGGGALAVGGGVIGAGGAIGKAGIHGVGTVGKVGYQGVGVVGKAGVHTVGNVGKFGIKGVTGIGKGVGTVGKGVYGGARRLTGHARTKSGDVVPIALDDEGRPILDASGSPLIVDGAGNVIGSGESLEPLVEGVSIGGGGAGNGLGEGREGTLRIQVGSLTGCGEEGEKKAVQIKLNGGKTILETHSHKGDASGAITFNDSAVVKSNGEQLDLDISVMYVSSSFQHFEFPLADLLFDCYSHKKRFGSDEALGTAQVSALDYVNALSPEQTLNLPISGAIPGSLELVLSVRFPFSTSKAFRNSSQSTCIVPRSSERTRRRLHDWLSFAETTFSLLKWSIR